MNIQASHHLLGAKRELRERSRRKMGLMLLMIKNVGLLLLLISASLSSTCSFAGRHSRFASNSGKELPRTADLQYEEVQSKHLSHEEGDDVHERLLNVNTKDYGRYDPAPALGKPPFKLIPN